MIPPDKPLVADASFVSKLYLPEADSDFALAYADRERHRLFAPDLLLAEVGGALFRGVRDGKISRLEGDIAMRDIHSRFPRTFSASRLLDSAWQMSMTLRHAFPDCVYLALAVRKNGLLVTADEDLLRRVNQSRWNDFAAALRNAPNDGGK